MKCFEKKCAIVNYWWADGHGAALTAFALSKLLSEGGFEPCLIKTTIGVSASECEKGRNFKFIQKYVKCTSKNYITYKDYRDLNKNYNHFLLGSDQVLRLEWVPDEWYFYAIDYKKNIVAVAASFGTNVVRNSKSRIKGISRYLDRFNSVSLRELDGPEVYKTYFGKRRDLSVIADPVFLIAKEEYETLILQSSMCEREPFVFLYILDFTDESADLEKKIGNRYKMKIIKESSDMSIEDFLDFVKNCTLMVTDSFHGTCFSIIFNRPFYCIYNKERGASRIDTLKELFEIDTSRFTCYADLGQLNFTMEEMDYKQVNEKIIEERNRGQQWILNSLKLPGKKCFKWCIADRAEVLIIHLMNRIVGKLRKKRKKHCRPD